MHLGAIFWYEVLGYIFRLGIEPARHVCMNLMHQHRNWYRRTEENLSFDVFGDLVFDYI